MEASIAPGLWARLAPKASYRRHALVSSLTSMGIYGCALVTGPIIARALGPTGRGDIAAVMAPSTILPLLIALGLPMAAAYFVDTVDEGRLLATATAFGMAVGIPVCTVLWVLAPAYLSSHSPLTVTWARILLAIMPLSTGMAAALEIRRRLTPGMTWNLWRAAPFVIPTVGTVVLALTGRLTLESVFAVNFAGALSPVVLLLSRWARHSWPLPSLTTLRQLFPYAWRTAATGVALSLTSRLDQLVLVVAVPTAELGLYAVAVTIASVTNPLTSGLSTALFGHLRDDPSESRALRRFRLSLVMTLGLSALVAVGLAVSAHMLLRLGFGSRFTAAADALRLLLPGAVAYNLLGVIMTKLLSEGRPAEASRAALVGFGITVLGLVVLVPRFGIRGAATVTSLAYVSQVVFLVARGALRRSTGLDVPSVETLAAPTPEIL